METGRGVEMGEEFDAYSLGFAMLKSSGPFPQLPGKVLGPSEEAEAA